MGPAATPRRCGHEHRAPRRRHVRGHGVRCRYRTWCEVARAGRTRLGHASADLSEAVVADRCWPRSSPGEVTSRRATAARRTRIRIAVARFDTVVDAAGRVRPRHRPHHRTTTSISSVADRCGCGWRRARCCGRRADRHAIVVGASVSIGVPSSSVGVIVSSSAGPLFTAAGLVRSERCHGFVGGGQVDGRPRPHVLSLAIGFLVWELALAPDVTTETNTAQSNTTLLLLGSCRWPRSFVIAIATLLSVQLRSSAIASWYLCRRDGGRRRLVSHVRFAESATCTRPPTARTCHVRS